MTDKKTSAGLLMYRMRGGNLEAFLVHPGGPYFANKDYWGIPKGELKGSEDLLVAAQREFTEETSFIPAGPFRPLGFVERPGKIVHAWAFEGDRDPALLKSNTCEVEWPPQSGMMLIIPEVDRGEYFSLEPAREKISKWQMPFLERLEEALRRGRE